METTILIAQSICVGLLSFVVMATILAGVWVALSIEEPEEESVVIVVNLTNKKIDVVV